MSWTAIALLALGTYALKGAGPILLGQRRLGPRARTIMMLLPAALLAGLAAVQTVGGPPGLVIDARLAGVAAAIFALAFRAPFIVVIVSATVTAALVRLVLRAVSGL